MEVVWQYLGENGKRQTGVKWPRQKVTKWPMEEAKPPVAGFRGPEKTGEAVPVERGQKEARKLRRVERTRKLVPATKRPGD